MRFEIITVLSQLYIVPTVKVTTSKFLYGYYNIEIWWLKWGLEIQFLNKEDDTN
jgi:hypothetical protein